MTTTVRATDVAPPLESAASAVSWGAIVAGAFAAATFTFILMMLGSGLGLTMVSPWGGESASLTTFGVMTAVWLVVVQWLASGLGGYLTGRLRTRWVGVHTDETFFRDCANGLIAWALATMLMVLVLGSAVSSVVGTGAKAVSAVATGTAVGAASAGAVAANESGGATDATSYFADALFRPADPAQIGTPGAEGDAAAAAEAARILAASAAAGEVSADDKAYLGELVAARTGLSEADATARVDTVLQRIDDAKVAAQEAADTARMAGATFALVGALSLLIGAFIASAAAALGGRQRDDDEALYLKQRV